MGTGTDVAMESAGVTLVKGDLRGIVRARRLSRTTMATAHPRQVQTPNISMAHKLAPATKAAGAAE